MLRRSIICSLGGSIVRCSIARSLGCLSARSLDYSATGSYGRCPLLNFPHHSHHRHCRHRQALSQEHQPWRAFIIHHCFPVEDTSFVLTNWVPQQRCEAYLGKVKYNKRLWWNRRKPSSATTSNAELPIEDVLAPPQQKYKTYSGAQRLGM